MACRFYPSGGILSLLQLAASRLKVGDMVNKLHSVKDKMHYIKKHMSSFRDS
jgi:hypothetical protein